MLVQLLPFCNCRARWRSQPGFDPDNGRLLIMFFWLRVAHAIGMISGLARLPLRPMIYFAGWVAMLIFAWQVLLKAA
jgi:MAPEG family